MWARMHPRQQAPGQTARRSGCPGLPVWGAVISYMWAVRWASRAWYLVVLGIPIVSTIILYVLRRDNFPTRGTGGTLSAKIV